jgi:hypothetical protein
MSLPDSLVRLKWSEKTQTLRTLGLVAVFAFSSIGSNASPPASHNEVIVKSEIHRAIERNISCLQLVSNQNSQSLDISPAYHLAAKSVFAQLEKLRLRDSEDATWVAFSKETDLRLTQMAAKTSSLGEAMLGAFIAMQYQAVVTDRAKTKSSQVRLTRKRAVIACAESLREGLNSSSWAPTDRCIDAKKLANDALEAENNRLDREIQSLQKELGLSPPE